MDTYSIGKLNFKAVRRVGRFNLKYWEAHIVNSGAIIPNIHKSSRKELWNDLDMTARACGADKFECECLLIE